MPIVGTESDVGMGAPSQGCLQQLNHHGATLGRLGVDIGKTHAVMKTQRAWVWRLKVHFTGDAVATCLPSKIKNVLV